MTKYHPPERFTQVPSSEITGFHYSFVELVCGVEPFFLSNKSSFYNFEDIYPEEISICAAIKSYWLSKINSIYGIDLSDVAGDDLNIARMGGELEKRLKQQGNWPWKPNKIN